MAEHPTAVWIRELYAAFFAGDMETAGQRFADDIVVHLAGRNPLSGTYHGKDQVFAMLAAESELVSDPATEIHDVLASDDHAVVLRTDSVSRNGRTWTGPGVDIMHVEDGKITEYWNIFFDLHGYDGLLNS
jgi:uncharacterized protein